MQNGYIKKANSIGELAKKVNLSPKVLRQTIDDYNQMMRKGKDNQFGRKTGLGKIQKPPFYITKLVPGTCDSGGGLVINTKAQVINVWNKPIKSLYAAGTTTSGWRGKIYPGSGSAVAEAIIFGRIAGQNIVKQNKKGQLIK